MWLNSEQIREHGFAAVGQNVKIDEDVRFFGTDRISIGDHTRLDAGAELTAGDGGGIFIGRHVHLSAGARISASGADVEISDFCGLAVGVYITSGTDDYVGGSLTNATVPLDFRGRTVGKVFLDKHVIIGANSVVLPGVTLGFGASVGALTVVRESLKRGAIVYGNPMQKFAFPRDTQSLSQLEEELIQRERGGQKPDNADN